MRRILPLQCWASAWAQWNTSATAKAFRWHSSQLSPCPALAIKLMELWQQLWLISGRNPLECSLSLQHHLHFSWSGWIFCRDSAQAVSFALGSPYKYSVYLKAHARSFAAGWLLFLLYFLLLVLNVCLGFGGWLHNTVFSLLQNCWANFKVMEEGEDRLMCWATFAHPLYDWGVIGTVDLRLPRICCQIEFFINWLLQSVLGCGKFNTFLTSSAQLVRRLL